MMFVAAFLVGVGASLAVVGLLSRLHKRGDDLRELLDLPYGEQDIPVRAVTEGVGPRRLLARIGGLLDRLDRRGSLARALERAQVPFRAGEYMCIVGLGAAIVALLLVVLTSGLLLVPLVFLAAVVAASWYPRWRAERWRRALETQLPGALALIASSLSAGHTFLRAIQNMCEESEPPLSREFERVVSETELGRPVVDALEGVANRTGLRDLLWVVQAIRIQQTVGGKLADLLHTLAEFMRAREEVRREVSVLTAEGRLSAIVLSALPVFLLVAVEIANPNYLQPMLESWHVLILVGTALWMLVGIAIMNRLVKLDV